MKESAVFERICRRLDHLADDMISLEIALTAMAAIAPENGGEGEWKKCLFLKDFLSRLAVDEIREINAPDPRVPSGQRPNLVVKKAGKKHDRTVWIITHLDVVPPGPLSLWHGDPFTAKVENGRIYGRGTEDNQQDLVASLFALKACLDEGMVTPHDVGLVFVSDEETSSRYGLAYLLDHPLNPFRPNDIIVVPDSGNPRGTLIEIAEKSIFWLKFKTIGKQCHASIPHKGINACLAASHLMVNLYRELHRRFDGRNPLFHPNFSTFEPTKREANVGNVNTIPGEDVFYLDARILPEYKLDEVKGFIRSVAQAVEEEFSVSIEIEEVQRVEAPAPTPQEAPVVEALKKAIYDVYSVEASPAGIGAGTVAAFLRKKGYPVAVWCRSDNTAHQPNEYALIENIVGDAKVFAHLFLHEI
ncbi:MAG TPA: M20 family metallo-hydrolase [Syntrophales bacterium]|nr:M20 family metallo-hydrolase [Syntrophales bacterium]HOL58555.1 M20 family metallo-hydrolase [Syntrophales bacterium]HPO34837.1 M20 family metallo-hydrolase [Syntrophales bacterium]